LPQFSIHKPVYRTLIQPHARTHTHINNTVLISNDSQ